MWRAPDAKGASGRKYTTANAALEQVRRKAAEPPPEPKKPPQGQVRGVIFPR